MMKALVVCMLSMAMFLVGCTETADKSLASPVTAEEPSPMADEANEAPKEAAEEPRNKYFIVVDKGAMQVQLHHADSGMVKAYRCACGRGFGNKRMKDDCRTPEGSFWAGRVYDSSDWHYTSPEGIRSPNPGQYGPKFIRIAGARYGSIGIHGTDSPRSLGRRVSHGCIRISNKNILELASYVFPGMKIIVKPGPKDLHANKHPELYDPKPAQTADTTAVKDDSIAAPSVIEELKTESESAVVNSSAEGGEAAGEQT